MQIGIASGADDGDVAVALVLDHGYGKRAGRERRAGNRSQSAGIGEQEGADRARSSIGYVDVAASGIDQNGVRAGSGGDG